MAERIWAASYDPGFLVHELPWIHAAAAGDYPDFARRLAEQGRQRRAGRSEGQMLSILCAEDAPRLAQVDTAALGRGMLLGAPVIQELLRACAVWPRGEVPRGYFAGAPSTVPTLLLTGALDPVAAPELADTLRRSLAHVVSYVDPRGGHGTFDEHARRLLVAFVANPGGW